MRTLSTPARRGRPSWWRWLAPVVLTLAVVLGVAAPASAHAALVSSEPASQARLATAPTQVVLTFDEPVESTLGGIRLYDQDEERQAVGEAQREGGDNRLVAPIEADLDDGLYVVTWRATSADGHPVAGAFTFQVGEAATVDTSGLVARLLAADGGSSSVGGALAVSRLVGYVGLVLLVGGLAFLALVWPQGARRRAAHALLWLGLALAVVGAATGFVLQGPYVTGRGAGAVTDTELWREVAGTHFGVAMLSRLAAAAAATVLILTVRWVREAWWQALAATVGAVLAFSVAYAGHAGTGRLHLIGLLLGTAHVAAMAAWLGGLAYLAAAALGRPRPLVATAAPGPTLSVGAAVAVGATPTAEGPGRPPAGPEPDDVGSVVQRFSRLAAWCVGIVVVSGVLQGWRILDDLGALFDTDYGRLLLVKTGLVVGLVALGALARRIVRQRWPARADLRRVVLAELIVAAAILMVTAVLVGTSPNEAKAGTSSYSATLVQGDTLASVVIEPARRGGGNAMHVYVSLPGGSLARVESAEARLELPSRDLGPIPVALAPEGVNHFSAYDVQFPFAGDWSLDLRVSTGGSVTRFTTTFPVR